MKKEREHELEELLNELDNDNDINIGSPSFTKSIT